MYQNIERIKENQKKRVNNDDDNEYIKMFKLYFFFVFYNFIIFIL